MEYAKINSSMNFRCYLLHIDYAKVTIWIHVTYFKEQYLFTYSNLKSGLFQVYSSNTFALACLVVVAVTLTIINLFILF